MKLTSKYFSVYRNRIVWHGDIELSYHYFDANGTHAKLTENAGGTEASSAVVFDRVDIGIMISAFSAGGYSADDSK